MLSFFKIRIYLVRQYQVFLFKKSVKKFAYIKKSLYICIMKKVVLLVLAVIGLTACKKVDISKKSNRDTVVVVKDTVKVVDTVK